MLFHGNNGYTDAPHCYIIRTLPVLHSLTKNAREFKTSCCEKSATVQSQRLCCVYMFVEEEEMSVPCFLYVLLQPY